MEQWIYLDNAATTFPKSEYVYEALDEANRTLAVNAGRGSYALAGKASEIIQETKSKLKKLSHAKEAAEVVLSSSATLACNQIFGGLEWKREDVVYVSPYEHNAVMRVLHGLKGRYGFELEELCLDEGTLELDMERIAFQFMRKKPDVVVMSHVSNVLGYILPIEKVAKLAEQYQAVVVVDGAQALGNVPVNLQKMPVDFYIFAGHKSLYGPLGVGGFINCRGRRLLPYLAGGTGSDSLNLRMDTGSAEGLEPGSYNVVAIAGLLASLNEEGKEGLFQRERDMTEYLVGQLRRIPDVTVYPIADIRQQVGIVAFNIRDYQASEVGRILDEVYHIAVRSGYQCAPLIHKYLRNEEYAGVVRASLGRFTTKEEIDCLVDAVQEIAEG